MFVVQIVVAPYRPSWSLARVDEQFRAAQEILHGTRGLLAHWQGIKFEEKHTRVWILLWQDLLSSQNFRTSESYHQVNQNLQPALFGRSLQWNFRALVGSTPYSGLAELSNIVTSAALEVATTLVVDGGVAGYYKVTRDITGPIMDAEPGAKGFFVAPTIEDPQAQMVLINWTSVDAHHKDFESTQGFQDCIAALAPFYAKFVLPWHVTDLSIVYGRIPAQ